MKETKDYEKRQRAMKEEEEEEEETPTKYKYKQTNNKVSLGRTLVSC